MQDPNKPLPAGTRDFYRRAKEHVARLAFAVAPRDADTYLRIIREIQDAEHAHENSLREGTS